jgi:hypothetical protein
VKRSIVASTALAALALSACTGTTSANPTTVQTRTQATATSAVPSSGTSQLIDRSSELVQPGAVHVDAGLSQARAAHLVRVAQTLYTFWNSGDRTYLQLAVDPLFETTPCPPDVPRAQPDRCKRRPDFGPRSRT